MRMNVAMLVLLVAASVAAGLMPLRDWHLLPVGIFVIAADLAIVAGYTYLFRGLQGAFYPAVTVLPVVYALVVPKRQALVITAAVTAAYSAGYWWGQASSASLILFAMGALAIPVTGTVVALSRNKQLEHEHQTELAVAQNTAMNAELKRWISELQAVSQITEVVHSSLEFDNVGPDVLDILSKVIGVEACCLFVVDKDSAETIFSATHGMSPLDPAAYLDHPTAGGAADEHFTCFPIFDHERTTVVFCTAADEADHLSAEDRLVLRTVASELVVAAENARLYRLSQHLAVTDELTKLPNYRSLQSFLDHELERSKRYDKRVSLLMIDADEFKDFNDSQGHVAGDVALRELARVIEHNVREVDAPARYGGEEFAVVLPETDAAGAFVVAEKIREAIAGHWFPDAEGRRECHLTVSIGVATYPAHASDKDSLLRSADDALYNAKDGGKNRVRTPRIRLGSPDGEKAGQHAGATMGDTEPSAR